MKTIIKTIDQFIKYGINFLKNSDRVDLDNINLDVKILIAHVLKVDVKQLLVMQNIILSDNQIKQIELLLEERFSGKPVYKIIGTKPFFKNNFITNEYVLDPRSDTEILVESIINNYKNTDKFISFLELGSGSGCVILSILSDLINSNGCAIDISEKAINTTKKNAINLQLEKRLQFINKNWNKLTQQDFDYKFSGFDCIISNPPYIKTQDIQNLPIEVQKFDPIISLDGGDNGLKCYLEIANLLLSKQIKLNNGAKIFLEIGDNQYMDVKNIFINKGFKFINYVNDLNNVKRVLIFSV